jgi:hypothetical protein
MEGLCELKLTLSLLKYFLLWFIDIDYIKLSLFYLFLCMLNLMLD